MKREVLIIFAAILLVSTFAFALAESKSGDSGSKSGSSGSGSGDSGDSSKTDSETKSDIRTDDGTRVRVEERSKSRDGRVEVEQRIRVDGPNGEKVRMEIREKIRQQDGMIMVGERKVEVRSLTPEQLEIIAGRINAKTGLNLTAEDLSENGTVGSILKAHLSNGRYADVKIMPDLASAIALEKLRAKCDERNCSVELKEVGSGNNTKAAYVIETEKDSRVLLIFKKKAVVRAEVDAETGEIINVRKPWWTFIAKEKHVSKSEIDAQLNVTDQQKVTICHVPAGDPAAAHTITVGAPAVRAHLAHGDKIGACAGLPINNTNGTTTPPINNTNVTIPTTNNTNVTIPTNNTNVNVTIPTNNTNVNVTLPGTNSTDTNVTVNVTNSS